MSPIFRVHTYGYLVVARGAELGDSSLPTRIFLTVSEPKPIATRSHQCPLAPPPTVVDASVARGMRSAAANCVNSSQERCQFSFPRQLGCGLTLSVAQVPSDPRSIFAA